MSANDTSLEAVPELLAARYIDDIYAPVCATLGIVGNTLALWVLMHAHSSSSTYTYMAALSVSDTLVEICNLLFFINKLPGQQILTEGTCGLLYSLFYFSIHYSVAVMVAMTVERYLAICRPFQAARYLTVARARVLVLGLALIMAGLDLQHLFIRQVHYDKVLDLTYCGPLPGVTAFYVHKIWPWVDGAIYCYIPLASLFVFNILILRKIRSSTFFQCKTTHQGSTNNFNISGPRRTFSTRKVEKEHQVTRMLLLVTFTFMICIAPMAVIIVVEKYWWLPVTPVDIARRHLVRTVFNNLSYTNHAVNFLLYCLAGKKFRKELRQSFAWLHPSSNNDKLEVKVTSSSSGEFDVSTVRSSM